MANLGLQELTGHSTSLLSNASLLLVDDVHNDAALEHLRKTDLHSESDVALGHLFRSLVGWGLFVRSLRERLAERRIRVKAYAFGDADAVDSGQRSMNSAVRGCRGQCGTRKAGGRNATLNARAACPPARPQRAPLAMSFNQRTVRLPCALRTLFL